MDKGCFDEYISIGDRCCSALALDEAKLRRSSYPFDWSLTTPKLVKISIENDFLDWEKDDKIVNGWVQNKYGISHPHHSKLDPEVRESTFKRRNQRFMEVLKSNLSICFIYTVERANILSDSNYEKNYEDVIDLANYISTRFPNFNFRILCIHANRLPQNKSPHPNIHNVSISKPVTFFEYRQEAIKLLVSMGLKLSNQDQTSNIRGALWLSRD